MRCTVRWSARAAALAVCIAICTSVASAADLPRRGLLGAAVSETKGSVTISSVLPGRPAEAAGLRAGDVVKSIDGVAVTTTAEFLTKVKRPAGRSAEIAVVREGRLLSFAPVLVAAPTEHDPSVDTRYEAVDVDHSLRRTLVTAPKNGRGKHPGILVIGGIGCYSIDVATNAEDPYLRLTHDLSRRGFVTMRMEKSGVGDSQGPPCSTVDFANETASYGVALEALARHPLVDPKHLYIVGHSIGSLIAPQLAARRHIAGVVVAEGVGSTWLEYELVNSRRQEELSGSTPADVDRAMLAKEDCMHRMLVERIPKSTVLAQKPACEDYLPYPAADAYMQEVASLDPGELWAKARTPVLAIYGDADFITDESQHRQIVADVNAVRPNTASLTVISEMDHYLTRAGTQRASFDRVTKKGPALPYDGRFSQTVSAWLCARENCLPARS